MRPRRLDSEDQEDPGARLDRALDETRSLLASSSQVWVRWSCPASGRCCQLRTTGRAPWLWPTEWLVLLAALEAQGRAVPPPRADGGCALLDAEGRRCTVYEARPSGCRTYFCDQGQGPALPGQRTHALLDGLRAVNVGLDPEASPRALPDWLADSKASPP
jgi:hypothetical protein